MVRWPRKLLGIQHFQPIVGTYIDNLHRYPDRVAVDTKHRLDDFDLRFDQWTALVNREFKIQEVSLEISTID